MNFQDYFLLKQDREDERLVIANITQGISFRGANVWILITAIFIASLGLNVNSTAVIIGAMLVSPLMGPITGMGLAVGIYDLDLFKRAFKNFVVATVVSILTATLYFLISPYRAVQSELLARTEPTLYDVLIAFVGGAAGIIALCVKDKGNVIPGVAIATALMPPLCTAGFGIATGNLAYFAGAFFLYFINTVFIALATLVGVRLMKFKTQHFIDEHRATIVHRTIIAIVLLTMIPAGFMTWRILERSYFNSQVNIFMRDYMQWDNTQVITHNVGADSTLSVVVVGRDVTQQEIDTAQQALNKTKALQGYELRVLQGTETDKMTFKDNAFGDELFVGDHARKLLETTAGENKKMKDELATYQQYDVLTPKVAKEIKAFMPMVESVSMARMLITNTDSLSSQHLVTAIVQTKSPLSTTDQHRLRQWLEARVETDSLRLIVQ